MLALETRIVKRALKRFKQLVKFERHCSRAITRMVDRAAKRFHFVPRPVRRFWRRQVHSVMENARNLPAVVSRMALNFATTRSRAATVEMLLDEPVVVDSPHGPIRFLGHGLLSFGRASALMTKEPDSLKWIDRIEPGSIFWDIGANVGTLTLYAASRETLRVWSFEPAAANYYNLVANCELNGYSKKVQCLQLGFSDRTEIAFLNVSQLLLGRSFSFKEQPNKPYSGKQAVQVWSIDEFIAHYDVPCPNYIKIDVPGLSHEILDGAIKTLSRQGVKEIQIEAHENSEKGQRLIRKMNERGFDIVHRNLRRRKRSGRVSIVSHDLVFGRLV